MSHLLKHALTLTLVALSVRADTLIGDLGGANDTRTGPFTTTGVGKAVDFTLPAGSSYVL